VQRDKKKYLRGPKLGEGQHGRNIFICVRSQK